MGRTDPNALYRELFGWFLAAMVLTLLLEGLFWAVGGFEVLQSQPLYEVDYRRNLATGRTEQHISSVPMMIMLALSLPGAGLVAWRVQVVLTR